MALEKVSHTWVDPVDTFPAWPGIPYECDVSRAIAEAYQIGRVLRLVLYSTEAAVQSEHTSSPAIPANGTPKAAPPKPSFGGNRSVRVFTKAVMLSRGKPGRSIS
jgi:hypothetical protein